MSTRQRFGNGVYEINGICVPREPYREPLITQGGYSMLRDHSTDSLVMAGYGKHGYMLPLTKMKFIGLKQEDYNEMSYVDYEPVGSNILFFKLRRLEVSSSTYIWKWAERQLDKTIRYL